MAENSLVKKLGVKPGQKMLILNAPEGYLHLLEPLPEGALRSRSHDFNVRVLTRPQFELLDRLRD